MSITPGRNIAIKVPLHRWDEMLAFYRDRVGLAVRKASADSVAFAFGEITLWLDRVSSQSQADIWLELVTDDPAAALARLGGPKRDELEPLDGVEGHWTSDPAGVVFLVRKP